MPHRFVGFAAVVAIMLGLANVVLVQPATAQAGHYLVVDLSDQRLYEFQGGAVANVLVISSGAARTPTRVGSFVVTRRINGWRRSRLGLLYKPLYFDGGRAIHGTITGNYRFLGRPASHGCVRVRQDAQNGLFARTPVGTPVIVQA
jgi:lipoprotein-anchoring transpeptidase ErfK/SrfK